MRWRRPSGPPTSPTPAPDSCVPSTTTRPTGCRTAARVSATGTTTTGRTGTGPRASWVYANDGPAEQSVSSPADDVEGWRFQTDEPDDSQRPAAGGRALVRADLQCVDRGAAAPDAVRAGARPRRRPRPHRPRLGDADNRQDEPAGSAAATATSAGRAPGRSPASRRHDHHGGGFGRDDHRRSAPVGRAGPAAGATDRPMPIGSPSPARPLMASSGGGSSSNLLPVILIAVVVVALGAFALFRWRRRPAEE